MRRWFGLVLGGALLVLAIPVASADVDRSLAAAFREVASQYRAWGRVDDEVRFAPWLCRIPLRSRVRVSSATAEHGRKVYFLYASDRRTYVDLENVRPRRGFTIVKESFHAAEVARPAQPTMGFEVETAPHGDPYRLLQDGERFVGPGDPSGLYIMKYVGRRAGTDAGWVYGTLDAEGEVTAAGRVASCMGCHRDAPHGRLFGRDQPGT
jgi:hypothetical protein